MVWPGDVQKTVGDAGYPGHCLETMHRAVSINTFARLDVHRMDQQGLYSYITINILSDEVIEKLNAFNDRDINNSIVESVLKTCRNLPLNFAKPFVSKAHEGEHGFLYPWKISDLLSFIPNQLTAGTNIKYGCCCWLQRDLFTDLCYQVLRDIWIHRLLRAGFSIRCINQIFPGLPFYLSDLSSASSFKISPHLHSCGQADRARDAADLSWRTEFHQYQ